MPLFDLKALVNDAKEVPWWGWALGGGAILAGGYYLRKASGAASVPASQAQPEYMPPDGLAMTDLAGLPVDYYDWSPGMPGGDNPPPPPATPPPPSGSPPPPPPTMARTITLAAPESFQQLADQYEGGQANLGWLLSWNQQLKSRPEYTKPWWPLPKGTRVNIPSRPTAGTGHGGGHFGGLHDWPEWTHLSAFDQDMLHAKLESGAMYG